MDRKILACLLEDGRIPFSTLAHKVGLSRVMVTKRVAELQRKGVIEKFTVDVPSGYIRKPLPAFFDIKCLPEYVTEVAEQLASQEDIVIVYQMSGRNTLHVHGFFRDIDEVSAFIEHFISNLPGIQEVSTDFLLKRFKSDRI
jgi:DNA-binding Lrp family transcriptional regulator